MPTDSLPGNPPATADTVYVDPNCPVCRRLALRLQHWQDGRLQLRNIGDAAAGVNPPGRLLLLRRLHLYTADGRWLTGLDAVLRVASHTRFARLAGPLRWPLLHPLATWLFDLWELHRYRRLYGCGDCGDDQRI